MSHCFSADFPFNFSRQKLFLFFHFPFHPFFHRSLTGQHSKSQLTWILTQHNTDNTHKNMKNVHTTAALTHSISANMDLPTFNPTPTVPSPPLNVIPCCTARAAAPFNHPFPCTNRHCPYFCCIRLFVHHPFSHDIPLTFPSIFSHRGALILS